MDSAVLRSRPVVVLVAGALSVNLLLGSAFVALHRTKDLRGVAVEAPADPLTDDQTRDQVMTAARQFIAAGRIRGATGSYILMPCREDDDPLYQGSVYLNFDLPPIREIPALFREIARKLSAGGWREGVPPGRHPGGKVLARDGVAAIMYRHPDLAGRGVLQVYGQCRDTADHRLDSAGFVDISRELYTR